MVDVTDLQPSAAPLGPRQRLVLARSSDHAAGPLLVVGGPGTGKTATLVEVVAQLVGSGRQLSEVLVLAPTRPLAQKLRNRVMQRIGGAQVAPRVMTAHAFAHAVVRGNQGADDREWSLLTAPEQEFRLREMLAGHDTSGWPVDVRNAATTRSFAGEVRAATARVRQLGLDPTDIQVLADASGRQEWRVLGEFMAEYLDVVDATASMDYAELVHRARLVMTEPEAAARVVAGTPFVLVDDFTELDLSQVQLLADLVTAGARIIAFADPTTSVFGFRGAAALPLRQFEAVFSGAGALAERISLVQDHQRASAITTACAKVAARLPRNDEVPLPQPAQGAEEGSVEVMVLDSPGAEIDQVVEVLRLAHLRDGVAWQDMAVITRSHRGGLLALARALTSAGVPVQMAGNDVALREAAAVRPLLLALQVVLALDGGGQASPDDALALLRSPLGGLDSLETRRLGRQLRLLHPGEAASSAEWFARMLADPSLAATVEGGPARRATELSQRLSQAVREMAGGADASRVLWGLWSGSAWATRLQQEALGGGEPAAAANRDIDAVRALFDLAGRDTGITGARAIRMVLEEIEGHEIPSDTAREADISNRGVQLLTAHRAKGLRWPLVVVTQVQEGTWPATRRRGSILEIDRLTRHGLAEPEPFSHLIDAERRSFLLACSRATRRLVVTAAQGHEGEGDQRSRFLAELGVEPEVRHGRPTAPVTLPMMVAQLRLTATDPLASPALRRAAATRLARMAAMEDSRGRPLARGADPAGWWAMDDFTRAPGPVVEPDAPVELHGSELAGLIECPRRWFLARKARGEAGRSTASSVGSVIHTLVEHAATEDLDAEALHGHLDQIWDLLRFDASWMSASEKVQAELALERYLVWADQNGRTLLGTEVPFTVELVIDDEHIRLRGSVDRLEQDSQGRLHVVDFKTGRSRPTKAKAAADPQLGLYQVAILCGGFDEVAPGVREVGGAELLYLREAKAEFPDRFTQPSLSTTMTLPDQELRVGPTWMHDVLADAAHIVRAERFHAQSNPGCDFCAFRSGCPVQAAEPTTGR